jgi:hypothetical protein
MKIENTIPCIVCKTPLDNLEYELPDRSNVEVHPMYGLHFTSYGHYGSTIFDPMGTGEKLDVAICDRCVQVYMANLDIVRGTGKESLEVFKELFEESLEVFKEIFEDGEGE